MGIINDKTNSDEILNILKNHPIIKNKMEINNNIENEQNEIDDFNVIRGIINEYEQLKKPLEKKNLRNSLKSNDFNLHQLERIKKWIQMASTKSLRESQVFANTVNFTNNNNHIIYNDTDSNNNHLHNQSLDYSTPIKIKNYKHNITEEIFIRNKRTDKTGIINKDSIKSEKRKNLNNNINIFDYTNELIENGLNNFYLKKKDKFKERIFKGPPNSFRMSSWMVLNNLTNQRDEEIYNKFKTMKLDNNIKESIIKDIERTFPNIEKVKELRPKEKKLYNVLKAFCNLDDIIGYCQGMNLIVGFLLYITDYNECDTFYILISLMSNTFIHDFNDKKSKDNNYHHYHHGRKNSNNIRGLFSEEFPLLMFLDYIFNLEFKKNLPNLYKKFSVLQIPNDLWIVKWFQTIFTIILPLDFCKRVWDCFLVNGIFFLVKFAIEIMKVLESDLMKFEEEIDILNYFKSLLKNPLNNNSILFEKCDVGEIITQSEKMKINVKNYYEDYIKNENVNFPNLMKKNFVVYDLNYVDFSSKNSNLKEKQTVLFDDEEEEENININNNIFDFKNLEENKLNEIKNTPSIDSSNIYENYDDDLDENIYETVFTDIDNNTPIETNNISF